MNRKAWSRKDKNRLVQMVENKVYTTQEIADELERTINAIHKQKSRMRIVNIYNRPVATGMPLFHISGPNAQDRERENTAPISFKDWENLSVTIREEVEAPELPVGNIQINILNGHVNLTARGLTYKQACRAMLKMISKIV